ncbi:hypothetical protein RIR_jg26568.t1 [Rhizophagus irregularis DAOM 181602=DAOM 197198]|nr:hypothetical protein RIR_jg26568.t1 [Rhizophagus irregularis DAOM 181602=DAOM 197198]
MENNQRSSRTFKSFENATCFLSGVKDSTISLDFINSQEKCNSIINPLKTKFEIFKHTSSSAVIFDKNIDELTTAMGIFGKKEC